MTQMVAYHPGTPCWADLGSTDIDASVRFYAQLFGWESEQLLHKENGGYTFFKKDGRQVAAVGGRIEDGHPSSWMTYVSVDDVVAASMRAESSGGKLLMEPVDVMEQGRSAIVADAVGAIVALWEPGQHVGAGLINKPGSVCWTELWTRNSAAAIDFYENLFGWKPSTTSFEFAGTDTEYTEWSLEGYPIAGMREIKDEVQADLESRWTACFRVEAIDDFVWRSGELGAVAIAGVTEVPAGHLAVLQDPLGARFSVIEAGLKS